MGGPDFPHKFDAAFAKLLWPFCSVTTVCCNDIFFLFSLNILCVRKRVLPKFDDKPVMFSETFRLSSAAFFPETQCGCCSACTCTYLDLLDLCLVTPRLPVYHRPQTTRRSTRLHPALSCAAVSIFLQLNLKPAVHISHSRSFAQVFLGRLLPLWPCGIHCNTCLAMLSSLRLSVCPNQFHFFSSKLF